MWKKDKPKKIEQAYKAPRMAIRALVRPPVTLYFLQDGKPGFMKGVCKKMICIHYEIEARREKMKIITRRVRCEE